ncbi:catecholate siderophore receptor CirA [Chryseobacterium indoltheticum]|uniref:Catecholate siderophore receptor CirA n=1 Tax=Chryseobacterium indoltheticum TaxID=254 RepID=A0A381FJ73_9FLAO|nr:TonB-dependent receptor plug domain-containing protein [Chryseobacterium indoltheticum]SUX46513.1 catecholate siderophore receptor CirA [Chryseobacterium indoltheticum]
MKKLTAGVLILVLSSSFVVAQAQTKPGDTLKTQEIEGVVVTALGIKREKKSLGYASEEVKAEALTGGTTNTGNVASLLSGKVSGLQVNTNNNFGGSANLLIRGYKSLSGGSPLIVIDGSPVNNGTVGGAIFDYGNFLSDINQEDIESINVLKGAAASALYGERGSDGVILIVTKNGKGKQDGKLGGNS